MNRCFGCGYMWADRDDDGVAITSEYCHYEGPDAWAPCEQDDYYDELRAEEEAYKEEIDAYAEWIEAETQRELEEEYRNDFYGEPYDYAEF